MVVMSCIQVLGYELATTGNQEVVCVFRSYISFSSFVLTNKNSKMKIDCQASLELDYGIHDV